MKTPIDVVKGRVLDIDERGDVTIKVHYDDLTTFIKRGYTYCLVQMIDSRPLSDKQRRACHALIDEIDEYMGNYDKSMTKEFLKLKFLAEQADDLNETIFSLSNAPMSLVCAFQRYLVRFILNWDIPTRFPLLGFVDDTADYVYSCLINKKCCICGRHADLHHVERVGMGRSRDEIIHEGMEALPLCREHHTEAHTMPDEDFFSRYHLDGGITLDKTLCRIYGLKTRRKQNA